MYVDSSKTTSKKGKVYHHHLLRQSFREDGKVKHRTIANISACSPEELQAIRLALRHKDELALLIKNKKASAPSSDPAQGLTMRQGLSVGGV